VRNRDAKNKPPVNQGERIKKSARNSEGERNPVAVHARSGKKK